MTGKSQGGDAETPRPVLDGSLVATGRPAGQLAPKGRRLIT